VSDEPKQVPANATAPAPTPNTAQAAAASVATGPASSSATSPSNATAPMVATAAMGPAHEPAKQGAAAAPPAATVAKPSANEAVQAASAWIPPKPIANDTAFALIKERFAVVERDPMDKWDLTLLCPAEQLRALITFMRRDAQLTIDMLLDISAIDYLSFPNHREARFAVVYLLKSLATNQRIKVKVRVEEEHAHLPTISDLFRIADWMEREAWDQIGIVFDGHPNLKRLLNHHEFVGHPLRKDYPCQKRQKLSVNDPMIDQLVLRLRQNGYTVLDDGGVEAPERLSAPGANPATGGRGQNDPTLQSAADGARAEPGGVL